MTAYELIQKYFDKEESFSLSEVMIEFAKFHVTEAFMVMGSHVNSAEWDEFNSEAGDVLENIK